MIKSLRLASISRILAYNDEKRSEIWKIIPNNYFDLHGGLNFLLRCNYNLKLLEQTAMPQFCTLKSMLQFFHELKSPNETDLGQDLFYLTTIKFSLIIRLFL